MISNILEFDDKNVSDIMTHRRNIVSIDAALNLQEAARIMAAERFSRYPVFEDDEDDLVGIVHFKDVMRLILDGEEERTVGSIMRQPMFVPDSQNINKLFRDMQARKIHMAIVVDEYGQSCGLVAMEDILEEIVGNIMDEYDADDENIQAASGGYIMKGMTPLDDVCDLLGITIEDDFDTLNGFLISRLERIPRPGEQVDVKAEGYNFRIMAVKDNAVSQVKVTKIIT
jgi:putative hemolysin